MKKINFQCRINKKYQSPRKVDYFSRYYDCVMMATIWIKKDVLNCIQLGISEYVETDEPIEGVGQPVRWDRVKRTEDMDDTDHITLSPSSWSLRAKRPTFFEFSENCFASFRLAFPVTSTVHKPPKAKKLDEDGFEMVINGVSTSEIAIKMKTKIVIRKDSPSSSTS
ncbi:hypothetical protein B9Z55_007835 [Caenorhabditis nigoni]|uniref:Uncharacterized protein n=1 Tax=Caenorhabditis nigoni TaxID=1611254 RepID=A0A2G5VBI8_9PELO|nr:hypothetical protein B9Z55_007835 [Caenorhabditis nigoni]